MIQINLIPDVKRDLLRAQMIRNWVILGSIFLGGISAGLVVLAALALGGLQVTQNLNEGNIDSKFKELSQISGINESIIVQNQLSEISNIRKSSPNVSRVIGQILPAIRTTGSNEVSFSSVSYNPETNTVTIEGQTSNDFSALEAFKKTIIETKILYRKESKGNTCTVSEANKQENGCYIGDLTQDGMVKNVGSPSYANSGEGEKVLRFSVSFVLNTEALKFETKDFAVKSPAQKDVTDSKTVISDDIFTVKTSTEEEK
ncbi:MAG: hypothetical protein Q4A27_02195 [bacterium]|nr:hypothetical protein [bacterium]